MPRINKHNSSRLGSQLKSLPVLNINNRILNRVLLPVQMTVIVPQERQKKPENARRKKRDVRRSPHALKQRQKKRKKN